MTSGSASATRGKKHFSIDGLFGNDKGLGHLVGFLLKSETERTLHCRQCSKTLENRKNEQS